MAAGRTSPSERGFAPPPVTAAPSPAAALSRAAALSANPGIGTLPILPRRIVNQEALECCVSCALGGAMEIIHPNWPPLAPLFHYHVTRFDNGGADPQGRLFLADGIGTLKNQGICRDADHHQPFTAAGVSARPSKTAFTDARTRRIRLSGFFFAYERLGAASRTAAIRQHLRQGHPIVIGFTLPMGYPDSFLSSKMEWIEPDNPPPSAAHHCVLVGRLRRFARGGPHR